MAANALGRAAVLVILAAVSAPPRAQAQQTENAWLPEVVDVGTGALTTPGRDAMFGSPRWSADGGTLFALHWSLGSDRRISLAGFPSGAPATLTRSLSAALGHASASYDHEGAAPSPVAR